ncbi:MAG: acyloxyacyl hydrolase [Candidatus Coatesbacteria bacterium]|nr:acyloxyacyl hydrolase [Candidatus Coatesbacteria bacterium]
MIRSARVSRLSFYLILVVACGSTGLADALVEDEDTEGVVEQFGLGGMFVNTYKPNNDIQAIQMTAFAQVRPDRIWPEFPLKPLRFKVGCRAGITVHPNRRALVSGGLILLYYLGDFGPCHVRPYVEGGCHVIYTDFQVDDQGLRVNFNPQLALGVQFDVASEQSYFITFGLHHISNARMDTDNAGINSMAISIGRLF